MSILENLLDIDLNNVVTKAVSDKIGALESEINRLNQRVSRQFIEIDDLKKKAKMAAIANGMIDKLRATYAGIKDVKDHNGNITTNSSQGQYTFIRKIAELVYGITLEESLVSSLYSHTSIAYAARDHKDAVCEILSMVEVSNWCADKINEIRLFRMPSAYSMGEVKAFIQKLPYGYNGNRFGGIRAWIEDRFGANYMPYDMIMKSPYFVSDECFSLVVESIKAKKAYSEDLFALPMYNGAVTDDQIKTLGSLAVDIPIKGHQTDSAHGKFIAKYLHQFHKTDIDKLFEKINLSTTDWSALYWGIFPVEYQMKAFRKMAFKALTELLGNHSGRFTVDNREAIYADWFLHNPHPHTPKDMAV
jgi:hypothetical protein